MVTIFSALRIKLSNPLPLMIALASITATLCFSFSMTFTGAALTGSVLATAAQDMVASSLNTPKGLQNCEIFNITCMHIQNVLLVSFSLPPLAF